jgi:hypothetical protein
MRSSIGRAYGDKAMLAHLAHLLLDNRFGLVANACATAATGTAETGGRPACSKRAATAHGTVGGDTAYDVPTFVSGVRALGFTPHIAQKTQYTALDGRTTRTAGYAVSQCTRQLVEQVWLNEGGRLLRKCCIAAASEWIGSFASPPRYNVVRWPGCSVAAQRPIIRWGRPTGARLARARALNEPGTRNGRITRRFFNLLG